MEGGRGGRDMEGHIAVLAERLRGEVMVTVKEETWEKGRNEFQRVVVLKMANGEGINVHGLSNVLKRAWGAEKGVHFMEIPNARVVARFEEEEKLAWVMDNGPWMFKGVALLMKRWNEKEDLELMEMDTVKIWVQVHGIPLHIMTEEVGGDFAGLAGRVCKGGNNESEMMKRKFLRYQVELDVNKPIKRGCYLKREGREAIWIAFKYEKLPSFCKKCGSLKHGENGCSEGWEERRFGIWLRAENPEFWKPEEENSGGKGGAGEARGGAWNSIADRRGTDIGDREDGRCVRQPCNTDSVRMEEQTLALSAMEAQKAGSAEQGAGETERSANVYALA